MRRWQWLIAIAIVYCADSLLAQDVGALFAALETHYKEHPPSFPPNLTSLATKTVSEQFGGIRIHYVENRAVLIDSFLGGQFDQNGGFHNSFGAGETAIPTTRILKTLIDNDSDSWYVFDFSPGPSGDPHFILHRVYEDSTVFLGRIPCLDIFIPGDGTIYTAGHVNNMFDMRRLFTVESGGADIENDRLTETPQPFYWVGLETVTTAPLALFSERLAAAPVDTLPAGTPITVLWNKDDFYLITTPFGVTGWAVVKSSYYTPIQHLIFRGD